MHKLMTSMMRSLTALGARGTVTTTFGCANIGHSKAAAMPYEDAPHKSLVALYFRICMYVCTYEDCTYLSKSGVALLNRVLNLDPEILCKST